MAGQDKISERLLEKSSFVVGRKPGKEPKGSLSENVVKSK